MSLDDKYASLQRIFREMGSVVVAYSGGVDSALVLKLARDELGRDGVVGVLAQSATYPTREYESAMQLAAQLDVRIEVVYTEETDVLKFRENPPDRCYFCKTELYGKVQEMAEARGIAYAVDGSNLDDMGDFRPGMRAVTEQAIRSPLKEAGMTKEDIRALSRQLGLEVWDKPALACLSSRFPYGQGIDEQKLRMVDAAENLLQSLGFVDMRVRHDIITARIEVAPQELTKFRDDAVRSRVLAGLRDIGYARVVVDLEGYRQGSMNEVLSSAQKATLSNGAAAE